MKTTINNENEIVTNRGDYLKDEWLHGLVCMDSVFDELNESAVILNEKFEIVAANLKFYETFKSKAENTIHRMISDIGNGQWNTSDLKINLEAVKAEPSVSFKGYEVSTTYPNIGERTMLLNGRRSFYRKNSDIDFDTISILIVIEDITDIVNVAKKLAKNSNLNEIKMLKQNQQMLLYIANLEEKLRKCKKIRLLSSLKL